MTEDEPHQLPKWLQTQREISPKRKTGLLRLYENPSWGFRPEPEASLCSLNITESQKKKKSDTESNRRKKSVQISFSPPARDAQQGEIPLILHE